MPRQTIVNACYWLLLYTALWWLLAGHAGWGFGAVVVVAAVAASIWLDAAPWRFRLQFLRFFLWELCLGGWDVARRALHPRRPVDPAWVIYPLNCDDARVKLTLSAMVGLLPGTLSSRYEEDQLHIHTLDRNQDWLTTVADLERELACLLGATCAEVRN